MEPNILDTPEAKKFVESIYNELVDIVIRGQCLEFHKAVKSGSFFLEDKSPENEEQYRIRENENVFGLPVDTEAFKCICPICYKLSAATKFGGHLANCMGYGRKCRNTLSRTKINNSSKVLTDEEDDELNVVSNDDGNDSDWNTSNSKKKGKKKGKKTNNNKKRGKKS